MSDMEINSITDRGHEYTLWGNSFEFDAEEGWVIVKKDGVSLGFVRNVEFLYVEQERLIP